MTVTLLGVSLVVTLTMAPAALAQTPSPAAPAATKKQADRDQEAKRLFVSGNYRESIAVLTELYTETGNPIYLRNIARCYQRLRDPDRAIASFEEYLLRGKDVSAAEREEVKGFIRDLEELKRRAATEAAGKTAAPAPTPVPAPIPPPAARPAAPPHTSPAAAPTMSPASPPPTVAPSMPAPPPTTAMAALTPPPVAPSPPSGPSLRETAPPPATPGRRKRVIGVVAMVAGGAAAIAGGAVLTGSWISYNKGRDDGCGTTRTCNDRAESVQTKNRIAMGLLAGAAVAGGAGLALFVLNPAPPVEGSARPAGLTVAVRGAF